MQQPHRKRVRHFDEPGHVHFLTFSCYRRLPLLTNDLWRRMLCTAIDRAITRHRYRLFAFVIMPEHVHLLVQPRHAAGGIADLLRAVKRPFSYRIKQLLEQRGSRLLRQLTIRQRPGVTTFRFWQEGAGYDSNLWTPAKIIAALDYIHMNPVNRGLCVRCIDWKWSSARSYLLQNVQPDPDHPKLTPLPPEVLD